MAEQTNNKRNKENIMPTYYVSSEEHSAIELLKDIRYPLAEMIIHGKNIEILLILEQIKKMTC